VARIVNIRGTSGSGKSTIARAIMALYTTRAAVRIKERKQPMMYLCSGAGLPTLAVIGHYETDCGGTDTINGMDEIYNWVRQANQRGYNVLFEGLLSSAEKNRAIQLHQDGLDLHVLHIDIPLEECVASVDLRRYNSYRRKRDAGKAVEQPKPLNPMNTKNKWTGTRTTMKRLAEAGIKCYSGDRAYVLAEARRILGL
jgi:ABC-type oligopeptide transport system ATPase subunit